MSFAEAEEYCQSKNGHLAGISDSDEQEAVNKLLASYYPYSCRIGGYWTGDAWQWRTGESYSYTHWASAADDGDCIAVSGGANGGLGEWFFADDTSTQLKGFILEASITSLTLDTAPSKTEYIYGEALDLNGVSVTAQYADGGSVSVAADKLNAYGFDSSCGEKTVRLEYGGKYVSYTVTVTHDHSFGTEVLFEGIHPHRQYTQCECGTKSYTGENGYVDACPECNPSSLVPGDVNQDGDINTDDARLVLRFSVGLEELTDMQQAASDVDSLPGITTDDARTLLRYTVGLGEIYTLVI